MREPRKSGKLFTDTEYGAFDEKTNVIHDQWTQEAKVDEQIQKILNQDTK